MAMTSDDDSDDDSDKKEAEEQEGEKKDEKKEKKSEEIKLPEELIGQAIKEVVMHEVGHSLGLRHNFKASAMLSLDEINDPEITRKKGMVASVMDYNPLNVARKGEKQGDYATTTIGPYDYWAIEYAYLPVRGNEEEELKKIASRSPDPDLIYATDEDLYMSNDPLVNTYDLSNDTLRYAKDRIGLAQELLKNLDASIVRDGESWVRLRQAFSVLLAQYGNAAYMASAYVSGQYFSRDFKGSENGRDPIVPVSGEKQRDALTFLIDNILTDAPFQFSPELLRRLTTEHWYHWGSDSMLAGNGDFNVNDRVLRIQQIVLSHCLSADVLSRLQNQQLMTDADAKPLQIAEVFRKLTDGVWTELPDGAMPQKVEVSLIRRNLQRDHLRRLCRIVVGNSGSAYGDLYSFAVFLSGSGELSGRRRQPGANALGRTACAVKQGVGRERRGDGRLGAGSFPGIARPDQQSALGPDRIARQLVCRRASQRASKGQVATTTCPFCVAHRTWQPGAPSSALRAPSPRGRRKWGG